MPYLGTCLYAHCKVQHLHPITGAPPDYHWTNNAGEQLPRWTAAGYRRYGNDPKQWWYRVDEVARTCGVQPDAVRFWIKRGDLPAKKTPGGGLYLIKGADLDDFLRTTKRGYPAPKKG